MFLPENTNVLHLFVSNESCLDVIVSNIDGKQPENINKEEKGHGAKPLSVADVTTYHPMSLHLICHFVQDFCGVFC